MASATTSVRELGLHWSRWFHCYSSFELALVPDVPGIFTVAQEAQPAAAASGKLLWLRKQTLDVVEIRAVTSLFHALNQLFTPGCPLRESLVKGRCYLRYAVVPEAAQRHAALEELKAWLAAPGDVDSPLVRQFLDTGPGVPAEFRNRSD